METKVRDQLSNALRDFPDLEIICKIERELFIDGAYDWIMGQINNVIVDEYYQDDETIYIGEEDIKEYLFDNCEDEIPDNQYKELKLKKAIFLEVGP